MMIAESGSGISPSLGGRDWLTCDVAVDPFHRIGGGERERAGKHLVERDAQRVEIAARVDRAIHAPGLFRRHVGECAGNDLRRIGRLALAGQRVRRCQSRSARPCRSRDSRTCSPA